ncbi:oxalyl-CoA decarboxylase [Paraburkholderia ferrariae]|uniref:oxalyl-CoA decarboxylase n=1 Tax=Paraburkholderia ferrariae TaxID=386056 RepID=UPI00048A367C|nr:oxalyl-CoA decarboxylase [Paraburkholderia ferrariae]
MADSPAQAELTDGFHLVVEALKLNRIDTIYGVAGIPVTDLARLAQAEGIRYLGFRHEQSAGNAAAISGYLSQWPGVCLTVSAPGFLNGLVALANATTNGFPMIQISGSSDRAIIDLQQGDYEELDQMNAAKPFAKAAFRINRPEDIGIGVARAIRAAVSGRPGGVYLDLTAAALAATTDAVSGRASLIKVVDPAPARTPSQESVSRALSLLASAQRPLVILGKGAAYAQADEAIRAFLEETGIPYLPMSMAKGLLPDDHIQSAAAARSFVLGQADVVMLVGARLNWLLGHGKAPQWSADAKLIQVDIEPTEFDSNRAISAPVAGDIASAMAAFRQALSKTPVRTPDAWTEAISQRRKHNEEKMAANLQANPDPMTFQSGLRAVRDVLANNPDVYLVNEGANTLDFARNIIDMKLPRKRLDAGTWGVMGIGMGYSIGAAVTGGQPVVAIEGDSAFGFSGMEIETICRYRLPVVIVVFNNGGIYHGDDINRSGGTDPGPTVLMGSARYDRLIEAFGGKGYHVTRPEELIAALTTALAAKAPTLINCVIDPHAGTESGHLKNLNPKSGLAATK